MTKLNTANTTKAKKKGNKVVIRLHKKFVRTDATIIKRTKKSRINRTALVFHVLRTLYTPLLPNFSTKQIAEQIRKDGIDISVLEVCNICRLLSGKVTTWSGVIRNEFTYHEDSKTYSFNPSGTIRVKSTLKGSCNVDKVGSIVAKKKRNA